MLGLYKYSSLYVWIVNNEGENSFIRLTSTFQKKFWPAWRLGLAVDNFTLNLNVLCSVIAITHKDRSNWNI